MIDYEFSCFSYRIWDFGHYFCEMAIDATNPPKFSLNFDKEFPSILYQNKFIRYYLQECLRLYIKKNNINEDEAKNLIIDDDNINKFRIAVNIGVLWDNFMTFVVYGVKEYKPGPQFKWKADYAKQRIDSYFRRKKEFENAIKAKKKKK